MSKNPYDVLVVLSAETDSQHVPNSLSGSAHRFYCATYGNCKLLHGAVDSRRAFIRKSVIRLFRSCPHCRIATYGPPASSSAAPKPLHTSRGAGFGGCG